MSERAYLQANQTLKSGMTISLWVDEPMDDRQFTGLQDLQVQAGVKGRINYKKQK